MSDPDITHEAMKTFSFCAAHRVAPHKGKCRHLHGHNYKVEVHARWHRLNDNGMVIDFGDLIGIANGEIIPKFDHTTILHDEDPLLEFLMGAPDEIPMTFQTTPNPPTAEVIAHEILKIYREKLSQESADNCEVFKVVWETPTCCGVAQC